MKAKVSSLAKAYIVSNLRSQLATMYNVLGNIENFNESENGYAVESLKKIETNLRNIRKYLEG